MNFSYNLNKILFLPRSSSEFSSELKQLRPLEKFIYFHDQGAFSLLFLVSLLIHLVMAITFGVVSEIFEKDLTPIKARIGVRYAKNPSKPTLIKRSNTLFEKPVLKNLETDFKPKYKNIVPKETLLKKPTLKKSNKETKLLKPSFVDSEKTGITISKPQIAPSSKKTYNKEISKPQIFRTPEKPLLRKKKFPNTKQNVQNIPKFEKKSIPPSPIKSKKSLLKPKQIKIPQLSQKNISQKKIETPNFSSNSSPSSRTIPKINTETLKENKNKLIIIDSDSMEPIDNLFEGEQKINTPLPNILIPEDKTPKKNVSVPDISDLQRKKETQLAIEDYNNHISNQIKPNGQFPPGLFVRFLLTIIPSGEIIKHEFIEKSGFSPFDLAAELAVRNAVLDPLPQALAENPPYIVPIRIVPQN